MVHDVALGVGAALGAAGVLAPEGRGAVQVMGTVEVALALVTAALEGSAPEARETAAGRDAVYDLALGVDPTRVGIFARCLWENNTHTHI